MNQILTDTYAVELELVESENGSYVARGEFARVDFPTGNKRVYPRKLYEREIKNLAEDLKGKKVFGELDHPSDGKTKLQRVSHLVTNLTIDNDRVIGEAEIMDTDNGRQLKSIIGAGAKVGISSRGFGSVKETKGGDMVVQDDFRLMTFDFVANPADNTAYPTYKKEDEVEAVTVNNDEKQEEPEEVKTVEAVETEVATPEVSEETPESEENSEVKVEETVKADEEIEVEVELEADTEEVSDEKAEEEGKLDEGKMTFASIMNEYGLKVAPSASGIAGLKFYAHSTLPHAGWVDDKINQASAGRLGSLDLHSNTFKSPLALGKYIEKKLKWKKGKVEEKEELKSEEVSAREKLKGEFISQIAEQVGKERDDIQKSVLADEGLKEAKEFFELAKSYFEENLVPEDAKDIVAVKDREIGHLSSTNEDLMTDNSRLSDTVMQLENRLFLEKTLAGLMRKDLVIEMLGDLSQYERQEDLQAKVESLVDKFDIDVELEVDFNTSKHTDKEVNEKDERIERYRKRINKLDKEVSELVAQAKSLQKENIEMDNKVNSLGESLDEAVDLAKRFGLRAYAESRLAEHPDRVRIRSIIENSNPDSTEAVDIIVDDFNNTHQGDSENMVDKVRKHIDNQQQSLAESNGHQNGVIESSEKVFGVSFSELRKLSGISNNVVDKDK